MKKKSISEKIAFSIVLVLFIIYAMYILYPFLFCLNSALKKDGRSFIANSVSIAYPPKFSNFITAFRELELSHTSYFGMIFNSLWYALGGTLCGLISSSMCAYVTAKYKFTGRNALYIISIAVMIIPIYGVLPAKYRMFSYLGMINSPLYLLSTFSAFGFNFLILYSFFSVLPWSYAEAAFIDGASDWTVFVKVMIPMAFPSVCAVAIMSFIGLWNDYETPLLFLDETPTLAAGLWAYERKIVYSANQPVYFAGVLLSLVPVFVIFGIFQNTIMQNVYAGGLKG